MNSEWLRHLVAGRPARVIAIDGDPYLVRYYVGRLLGVTVYLHRFIRNDSERAVHDHPWRALALVLTGSYTEWRLRWLCPEGGIVCRRRRVSPGRPSILWLRSAHRIATVAPNTWTLFVHGPRRKSWGFYAQHVEVGAEHGQTRVVVEYRQHLDTGSGTPWYRRAETPTGRDVERLLRGRGAS